ncbi:hypothetical protein AK812_SmicGene34609 [Symbiodinium microadriaticum]|uniref:Uncharacterized protein n=1 Tax=Symbiodinium microadriaticum TaxID=2951 RepID=A0A1Q9CNK7_SYMMI|nr:hypothetical protein AK812_SmicGene34609 [Symbiodinium microadriaticum]
MGLRCSVVDAIRMDKGGKFPARGKLRADRKELDLMAGEEAETTQEVSSPEASRKKIKDATKALVMRSN